MAAARAMFCAKLHNGSSSVRNENGGDSCGASGARRGMFRGLKAPTHDGGTSSGSSSDGDSDSDSDSGSDSENDTETETETDTDTDTDTHTDTNTDTDMGNTNSYTNPGGSSESSCRRSSELPPKHG